MARTRDEIYEKSVLCVVCEPELTLDAKHISARVSTPALRSTPTCFQNTSVPLSYRGSTFLVGEVGEEVRG